MHPRHEKASRIGHRRHSCLREKAHIVPATQPPENLRSVVREQCVATGMVLIPFDHPRFAQRSGPTAARKPAPRAAAVFNHEVSCAAQPGEHAGRQAIVWVSTIIQRTGIEHERADPDGLHRFRSGRARRNHHIRRLRSIRARGTRRAHRSGIHREDVNTRVVKHPREGDQRQTHKCGWIA